MFSDTHCHLRSVRDRGENLGAIVSSLGAEGYRFVLDIGTQPGDFNSRVETVRAASASIDQTQGDVASASAPLPPFIHFSVGLWPDAKTIENAEESLRALETDAREMLALASRREEAGVPPFAALGECGLDRYWNGPHAAERIAARASGGSGADADDDGPGTVDVAGEENLFAAQLDMARRLSLPVIVHSRDAFEPTLAIVRNSGCDAGVIHCFSYGIDEARAFLDRGFYISFPGTVTWPKKEADRDRVRALVNYVPRDRLLLETDAPYLAPAPHRGKTNTPYLVRHVYERVAEYLGVGSDALAAIVYANARDLFGRDGVRAGKRLTSVAD